MSDDRELIDEQIAYYRARAAEYDATSMPDGDPFAAHADTIRAALRAFEPRGRVLELGAGTGQWTGILAEYADELLVTDASPEMLELNRAKVGDRPDLVRRVLDAFALAPSAAHDVVFFGFLLSHVPPRGFDAFWEGIRSVLAPAGRVFLVDEGLHREWREDWIDEAAGIVRRPLSDGTVHGAIKVLWRAADLERRLTQRGWDASVHPEGPFYWATATR